MERTRSKRAATATWSGISTEAATWVDGLLDGVDLDRFSQPGVVEAPYRSLARGSGEVAVGMHARVGPYRLLRILGEGGMARVYEAEHTVIAKRVAVKTLLPEYCTYRPAQDVLEREARIAAQIRSPHAVEIYDFAFDERGCPYFVMELAPGETLAKRLERDGPLLMSQALDISICMAEAAATIHRAGYLHRDIKAENVICVPDGERYIPKLIDFGIARPLARTDEQRETGMVGTPRTMAPEQVAQEPVDERTDIWALGIMLYEMLTAELPFSTHDNIRDDLVAIVTESPRPLPLGLGGAVCRIIESCLSKDPEGRPQSAEVLCARLRRAQAEYVSRNALINDTLNNW